ncbi:MAG: RsbRD N-terminal domain-containing protein [Desulfosoma sp.]|uniref:RsbRD N-terminal domain-containing protein n=1 Tax=Desulfosoma sp. TaxID=2603217 RepID=UPI00404A931D
MSAEAALESPVEGVGFVSAKPALSTDGGAMSFDQYLQRNQKAILKEWFQAVVETYPEETARFLKKERDPFTNPVGSSILEGIEGIFMQILGGLPSDEVLPFLDRIVRVRAVQDFTPAQAVAFMFALKDVVRSQTDKDGLTAQYAADLVGFERTVDRAALMAFNIYMECREKLYQLRVDEIKNRTGRLLERANAIWESRRKEDGSPEES